jgi:molybdate transport repressor ModE-like protein
MGRIDEDVVGKLEQAVDRAKELARAGRGASARVQIGPPHVANQQRVTGENKPWLLGSPAAVAHDVGMVSRRVTGRRKRADDRVPKLDDFAIGEGAMLELHEGARRQIGTCSGRLDQRRQARHVVGLNMRLEDRRNRCADSLGGLEIAIDEVYMGIHDRKRRTGEAAEQIARAGRLLVQEGAQDHLPPPTVRRRLASCKAKSAMAHIGMADKTLSLLWDATRLRLLVEIERRGSLSAAAREVGIGQPSASEHVRLLEAAAGQPLVERNGRGSRLTEAGRVLASSANQALATLAAGEEELQALAGLAAGTIHIGASTTPGVYLLPDTLGCFRRDHPNVVVEVEIASTGEIIERLLAGRIQLALVGEATADERVTLEPFLEDEIIGVAKPGLLRVRSGRVKRDALQGHTLLVRAPGSSTRQIGDRELARAGVDMGRAWELDSSEAIKRAAREGLGVAFLSRYAVAEEVERGEVESFRLAHRPPMNRQLHIARLARRPLSPSERGFVATLTHCCAKSADFAAACVA